jgi:Pyridoxamine 5'-phosphate oxidase
MRVAAKPRHAAASFLEENVLARIPQVLHEHINTAYPANVCLVGTVLPDGFAQITPRGSTMVFDDEHIALWERGKGTTTENLTDGTPVTIFMRKAALREAGILPKGGILRLYGRAKIHKSGAVYEEIWNRLIEAEKKGDPEMRGYAVLVTIERAEDLSGQPLT